MGLVAAALFSFWLGMFVQSFVFGHLEWAKGYDAGRDYANYLKEEATQEGYNGAMDACLEIFDRALGKALSDTP